jgi:MFS family permease
MAALPRSAGEEWKAHWPMIASGMIGFSFYSMVTYSLGTFMAPLQQAFGWSRTQVSIGLTIFGLTATLAGPPMGMLLDRFGARRIALAGLILSGATFACLSFANGSHGQWIGLWLVFSLCSVLIKSTVWSAGASSVFAKSRGLALAAMLSGSAVGQTFAPLIANALIQSYGWRGAYIGIGIGWGGLAALLVALFFFDAHALGMRKTNLAGETVRLPGLTIRGAFSSPPVIRIAIANLITPFVGAGVTVHLVPLIAESGAGTNTAVEIAATAGIAGIVGKFLSGWLLDRVQGSVVPVSSALMGALGYLLLLDLMHTRAELLLGTMCLGYSAGSILQVSTYLITRYAGLRNFGVIFGIIASSMMFGTSFGPLIAARVHDVTGHYDALLWIAVPVMLVGALLFLRLGPYPHFADPDVEREVFE